MNLRGAPRLPAHAFERGSDPEALLLERFIGGGHVNEDAVEQTEQHAIFVQIALRATLDGRQPHDGVGFDREAVASEEFRHFLDGEQLAHGAAAEIGGNPRILHFAQARNDLASPLLPLGFFEVLQGNRAFEQAFDGVERNPGVLAGKDE